jgi:hypothetical protein
MTSGHVADRATAYLTGELSDAERAVVESHLSDCAECRAGLENVRTALRAVSSWPREPDLAPELENRILRGFRGSLPAQSGGERRWRRSRTAAVIVGVLCGSLGFAAGRLTGGGTGNSDSAASPAAADSSLRSYLLLLEEPVWPPVRPLARSGYGEWARAIAAEARFVGAEKLTEEPGYRVSSAGAVARPDARDRPPNVSGWYVVRARGYEEAIAWARRGPHLAFGSVLVREIEDTPRTTR